MNRGGAGTDHLHTPIAWCPRITRRPQGRLVDLATAAKNQRRPTKNIVSQLQRQRSHSLAQNRTSHKLEPTTGLKIPLPSKKMAQLKDLLVLRERFRKTITDARYLVAKHDSIVPESNRQRKQLRFLDKPQVLDDKSIQEVMHNIYIRCREILQCMINLTTGTGLVEDVEDTADQQEHVVQKSLYLFNVTNDLTAAIRFILEHRIFFLLPSRAIKHPTHAAWTPSTIEWWDAQVDTTQDEPENWPESRSTDQSKQAHFWSFIKSSIQCLAYTFHSDPQAIRHCSKDFTLIRCLFELLQQKNQKQKEVCGDAANLLEYIFSYCGQNGIYFDLEEARITDIVANIDDIQMPSLCRVLACCLGDWELYPLETDKALEADTKLPYPSLLTSTNHILTSISYKQNKKNEQSIVKSESFIKKLCDLIFRKPDVASYIQSEQNTYMLNEMIDVEENQLRGILSIIRQMPNLDSSIFEHMGGLGLENLGMSRVMRCIKNVVEVVEMGVKIEASFVLTLLLAGKSRKYLSRLTKEHNFIGTKLRNMMISLVFEQDEGNPSGHMTEEYDKQRKSQVKTLQQQFLRLIHTIGDHHHNKYWLMSDKEVIELRQINGKYHRKTDKHLQLRIKECHQIAAGQRCAPKPLTEAFLKWLVNYHKGRSFQQKITFWLDRALEGLVRAHKPHTVNFAIQMYISNEGFIEKLLDDLRKVLMVKQNKLDEIPEEERENLNSDLVSDVLQGHCDLLAELLRFNTYSFMKVRAWMKDNQDFDFFKLIHKHLVDTNMLLRTLILSSHLFDAATNPENYSPGVTSIDDYIRKYPGSDRLATLVFPDACTRLRLEKICSPTKPSVLCPKIDHDFALLVKSDLAEYRSFSTKFDFLCELCSCLHAKQLSQENISCLNTGIAILNVAYRQGELPRFLNAICQRDLKQEPTDWSFSVKHLLSSRRDTEVDADSGTYYPREPVPLVLNMIQLLTFWKQHYFLKIKESDCVTLVQCTAMSIVEWSIVIQLCLEQLWELARSTPSINKCLALMPKYWYDVHHAPTLRRERLQIRKTLLQNPDQGWEELRKGHVNIDGVIDGNMSSCESEASLSSDESVMEDDNNGAFDHQMESISLE